MNSNDYTFELPTNLTTAQAITEFLLEKNIYKTDPNDSSNIVEPTASQIGDNIVGFLSQIGWSGDSISTIIPRSKIQMERIFVDVDTNGGNGDGQPVFEMINALHNKIPHRQEVIRQILYYLYN